MSSSPIERAERIFYVLLGVIHSLHVISEVLIFTQNKNSEIQGDYEMNNHDLYRSNRKSEDIVYLYTNGETDRYIKTEEGIILVHTNVKGGKTTSLLPATVMSVEEFDALKKHSDESYENMAGSDYLEERNCTSVISFDEASIADTEESPEERMIREMDEMEHPSIDTWGTQ